MFWLLRACWPSLRIPTLRRAWHASAYALAPSALIDPSGRRADWAFKADGLEIAVDLARGELRVCSAAAQWRETQCEWIRGPVEFRRPLLECSIECESLTKTVVQSTGVHVAASGAAVAVHIPNDSLFTKVDPARYRLCVTHWSASLSVVGGVASRGPGGSMRYGGSSHRGQGMPAFSLEVEDLPKAAGIRLRKEWKAVVEPMIDAARKAFEAEFMARAKAEAIDAFLRDESAIHERRSRGEALAQNRLNAARALGEVGDEFFDMSHVVDGEIVWAISAGRDGRAALIQGGASWSGSLAGACASIVVAEKAGPKTLDILELVVEVDDAEFKHEHLAKRRFHIMRGWPKDRIAAWADRIESLASAAGSPPTKRWPRNSAARYPIHLKGAT